MTSVFATNATDESSNMRYALLNKTTGLPSQGQFAKGRQEYTGAGGVTIDCDGLDVLHVNTALASGDLTIDFSTAAKFRNMIGRTILIHKGVTTNDVILDFPASGVTVNSNSATYDAGGDATLAAATRYSVLLNFIDASNVILTVM